MRINKLDGLRGLFSLMVVIYHYPLQYLPSYVHEFFIIEKSYLFVDFFFVLSGFVIALNYDSLLKSAQALLSFMTKRFVRLYPLLIYSTLLYCFLQVGVKIFMPQYAANKDSFMPTLVDTIDTLLFLNSTPVITNSLGMNYPSWSISAEMISYLAFGLVTLWAIGKRKNLVLAAGIIIGMFFLIWVDLNSIHTNFNFVRGIVSFNLGYFVFRNINPNVKFAKGMEVLVAASLVLLLYAAQSLDGTPFHGVVESAIIPLFFGLAIYIIIHCDGFVSKAMEGRVFQYLGKISYSLYLNHAIVLLVVPLGIFAVLKVPETTTLEFSVFPFVVLAVIVYSNYTYHFIEVGGGRALKKLLTGPRTSPGQTTSQLPIPPEPS